MAFTFSITQRVELSALLEHCNENLKALGGQKGASRSKLINKYGYFSSGSIGLGIITSVQPFKLGHQHQHNSAFNDLYIFF